MKLFHAVEDLMMKLSGLPGLHFLANIVMEHKSEATHRQQTLGKYKSYVQTLRGAASDAGHLGKGHDHEEGHGAKKHARGKTGKAEKHVEETTEDIDDEFEEEEDDDFESYML